MGNNRDICKVAEWCRSKPYIKEKLNFINILGIILLISSKTCPYFKKEYLDDNIHEPALMSPSDLYFALFTSALSAIAVVVVISILISSYLARFMSGNISSQVNDAAVIKFVIPLSIIISVIAFKVYKPLNFKNEVNASLERLAEQAIKVVKSKVGLYDVQ